MLCCKAVPHLTSYGNQSTHWRQQGSTEGPAESRAVLTNHGQVSLIPAVEAALQVHHIISSQPCLINQLEGGLQGATGLALRDIHT